jgi:hypothetical protein
VDVGDPDEWPVPSESQSSDLPALGQGARKPAHEALAQERGRKSGAELGKDETLGTQRKTDPPHSFRHETQRGTNGVTSSRTLDPKRREIHLPAGRDAPIVEDESRRREGEGPRTPAGFAEVERTGGEDDSSAVVSESEPHGGKSPPRNGTHLPRPEPDDHAVNRPRRKPPPPPAGDEAGPEKTSVRVRANEKLRASSPSGKGGHGGQRSVEIRKVETRKSGAHLGARRRGVDRQAERERRRDGAWRGANHEFGHVDGGARVSATDHAPEPEIHGRTKTLLAAPAKPLESEIRSTVEDEPSPDEGSRPVEPSARIERGPGRP